MGFSSVYRVLQEVFPQVDSRLLRAFAIEHSKDADVAVEAVLTEVIPQISEQSLIVRSANKNKSSQSSSEVVVDNDKTDQLEAAMDPVDFISEKSMEAGPSNANGTLTDTIEAISAGSSVQINSPTVLEPIILEQPLYSSALSEINKFLANNNNMINPDSSPVAENGSLDTTENSGSFYENDTIQLNNVTAPAAKDDSYIHLDLDSGNKCVVTQEPDSDSLKTTFEKEGSAEEIVNPDDESTMNTILTKSEQKCSTQLLEEIFEEAKNNKNTVTIAMNSVVELIKEVESKEKAAEEVKEEASQGCSYYYAKVDELKQALLHAKDANDMHAGEVYAEKAILATELKELQLRLLTLSDEKNKSLSILDEMRKALEIRLAQATEEIRSVEEQKFENEKAAKEELLFQEIQMEKVVEESKKLKLQAEENSKLQEYLMDRGRAIDILQGEIFVKCQDVLLLKEKFDKRIPFSRSLSCSQSSSILASSNSSFRSTGLQLGPEPESFRSPKTGPLLDDSYGFLEKSSKSESGQPQMETSNPINDYDDEFPSFEDGNQIHGNNNDDNMVVVDDEWELFGNNNNINNNNNNINNNNNKVVVDDEWELFDKDEFLMSR